MSEANYASGEDFEVEFLSYRFTFNQRDFEERVVAAAIKLGIVEGNELDRVGRSEPPGMHSGANGHHQEDVVLLRPPHEVAHDGI